MTGETVTCMLCGEQIEPQTEKAMADHLYGHVLIGVEGNDALTRIVSAMRDISSGTDCQKFFDFGEKAAKILKGKFK